MLAYVADPERMARFYEQALGLEGLRGRVEGSPAGAAGGGRPRGGGGGGGRGGGGAPPRGGAPPPPPPAETQALRALPSGTNT